MVGAATVSIVTAATGGVATTAFVAAARAGLKTAAITGLISAGEDIITHRITTGGWQGAQNNVLDSYSNGFMMGGIMSGGSMLVSGGFGVAAKLGVPTGRNGGFTIGNKIRVLSPNYPQGFEMGGTLLKIGSKYKNLRVDFGSRSMLHLNVELSKKLTCIYQLALWVLVFGEVLKMIRLSKLFFTNPAKIWICGAKCNLNNIIKISGLFEYKWVVMTIDSISKESSLFVFIRDHGFEYYIKQSSVNYIEVSVALPYSLLEIFLEKVLCEEPENIFILNLLKPVAMDILNQQNFEKFVVSGVADVFTAFNLDNNTMSISVNKHLIKTKEVYKQIKKMCFSKI